MHATTPLSTHKNPNKRQTQTQTERKEKGDRCSTLFTRASPLDYKSAKHFPHNYEITDLQNLTRATESAHTHNETTTPNVLKTCNKYFKTEPQQNEKQ
jgi:hypothetical protein